MQTQKKTFELNEILRNTAPDKLEDYFKENEKYMADDKKGFSYYMQEMYSMKKVKLKDIYILVGVTESYGSKIIRMEKHTKNRDLIIRFCIAGKFDVDEVNRALKLYGMNELYPRNKRDAAIFIAIDKGYKDIYEIDDYLEEQGYEKLSSDKNK